MHARVNTQSWTAPPTSPAGSELEWRICSDQMDLDGVEYHGFSYEFRYRAPGRAIYQIEDKATWELKGNAAGNTFIMRGAFAHPITKLGHGAYDSGWTHPGADNPFIFQHLPLYAQLQGFTFQHDDQHVLLTVHERPSHVRSLFHKDAGSPLLLHFNQFCFDLAEEVQTPPRRVLLGSKRGSATDLTNHYLRVRREIQAQIRSHYGIRHELPQPSAHVETWGIARMEQFAAIFDQLHRWGIERAFVMPLWRSNETDIKPRFAADEARFGELGNMCCPLELEIADCYGGWDGLRRILSSAKESGIETYTWVSPHLSSVSPLRKQIKDLFARDMSGQGNRNNYGHVLLACNQNSEEYQAYFLSAMRRLKDCGMMGVFRDSHFNMAVDTINFTHSSDSVAAKDEPSGCIPMVRSQHDTEVAIQRRIQSEIGLMYYVESAGILGTPMAGIDYDWVRGCEFIWADMETQMNLSRTQHWGDNPEMVYFRGLSVRLFYQVNVEVNGFPQAGSIDTWWNPETMVPMVRAYHQVKGYMGNMEVLDGANGVRWTDGTHEVIFAYQDIVYPVGGRHVVDVVAGRPLAGPQVEMRAMGVYLIGDTN